MAEPVSAATTAAANLAEIADRLGILQAVKQRLVSQPDPAAAKLDTVLDEIHKIYLVLDTEITSYLSLWLDPSSDRFVADRETLLGLEGGALSSRMRKAKTACSKIGNIYDRYLRGWFSRVTSRDEAQQLGQLFRELRDVDSQMIDAINKTATWLEQEAEQTLNLVQEGNFEGAQQRIDVARQEIRQARRDMSRAMQILLDLQSGFVTESGGM
jgi:multidrug efflux pump subunit AcrA (membrane-fusion protein)